jgi:hypothetical protein
MHSFVWCKALVQLLGCNWRAFCPAYFVVQCFWGLFHTMEYAYSLWWVFAQRSFFLNFICVNSPHFLPFPIREIGVGLYTWQKPMASGFLPYTLSTHGTQYVYKTRYIVMVDLLCRWQENGTKCFIGLAYQGKKDIVFRFIIEYSSLRDFYRPP